MDPATAVTGVTLRASDVRPGDLFAALPGARAHGADFAAEALARGAAAVLTDPERRPPPPRATRRSPCSSTPGPARCSAPWPRTSTATPPPHLGVIGITGTSGKTTVAHLVEAGLAAAGRTTGMLGTVGIRIDGQAAAQRVHHPRSPRPAGAVRGDARGRASPTW